MNTVRACILLALVATAAAGQVGDILQEIDTPGPCPSGLAFDGRNLWLADSVTDMIYKIDTSTGKVTASFESPGHRPEGLAWDGKSLWHTDSAEKFVYCLDPANGKAVKILEASTEDPRDVAWDGQNLWVADHKKDVLLKISPTDGMAVDFIKAPSGETTGLAFDGKYLWVADRKDDRIYLVNPADGMCLSSLRSYGPFPYGLAWDNGALWMVDYETRKIYKVKIFDDDILTLWDEKHMSLHFVKEFRNYGPGVVETLNMYLPLPVNRDNQKLLGELVFDIQPEKIVDDAWGQRIACFGFKDLKAGGTAKVGWKVDAKIYAAEYLLYPDKVGTIDDIPQDIKDKYLSDSQKYQINDPYIKKIAKEIAGDEKNPYWIARRVTEYLGEKLSYNLKPVGGWNPAPMILKRGTASCSEYSYSMIALCRALGVPIRYVGAVSERGDNSGIDEVFHRWVEVYLPPYGWIPFDANKADPDTTAPGKRVLGVGNVSARYIITTENGGGDKYLQFSYNSGYDFTSDGKCRVHEETYGLWSNLGEARLNKPCGQDLETTEK